MANIKINLNHQIEVELTEEGFKKWKEHDDAYLPIQFQYPLSHYKEKADSLGLVKMQLWDFMNKFGPFMKMGFGESIVKENNILI